MESAGDWGEGEKISLDAGFSPLSCAGHSFGLLTVASRHHQKPSLCVLHSFLPARFSRPSIHDIPVPAGGRRGETPCLGNANPDYPHQRSVSRSRPQGVSQPCYKILGTCLLTRSRERDTSPHELFVRNLCSNDKRKGEGCQVIN